MSILEPLDPVPSPSDSVLLDNSTYFSAKIAIQESVLDSQSVLNLATLLEAVVLKENVFFAPTSVWHPGCDDEPLFGPSSPCHSMSLGSFPRANLSGLFKAALQSSLEDLSDEALSLHTPHGMSQDVNGTRNTLLTWLAALEEDLDQFVETYSAKVFGTDQAALRFLSTLPVTRSEGQPEEKQFAHYLLRTNTAYQLSALMPYLPHSNRVRFVLKKLGVRLSGERDPGVNLLRVAERSLPADVPLVLSVVLSGATTPDDILRRALDLRNEKVTRRYRQWSNELIEAWNSGDEQRQQTAREQHEAARAALGTELRKLHARTSVTSRLWRYIKEESPNALTQAGRADLLRRALSDGESWLSWLQAKRRVAIFIELASKSTLDFDELNDHLSRVFGSRNRLAGDELENLHFLRSELL